MVLVDVYFSRFFGCCQGLDIILGYETKFYLFPFFYSLFFFYNTKGVENIIKMSCVQLSSK